MTIRGFIHKRYFSQDHQPKENGSFFELPKIYTDKADLLRFYKSHEISEIIITIEEIWNGHRVRTKIR